MATNIPLTGIFNVTNEYGRKGNYACGRHTGIDLTGQDTVYGTCDGIVERVGNSKKDYGLFVVVRDNQGLHHYFCHLSRIDVQEGKRVSRTSKIGIMGNTGNSTGKHLHYEIRNVSNKYADDINSADYMGIRNERGTYDSADYQINGNSSNVTSKTIKVFACKTNIRENPSLSAVAHLYKTNTTVEILAEDVARNNGYIWDNVRAIATGREGYVARTANRYK